MLVCRPILIARVILCAEYNIVQHEMQNIQTVFWDYAFRESDERQIRIEKIIPVRLFTAVKECPRKQLREKG